MVPLAQWVLQGPGVIMGLKDQLDLQVLTANRALQVLKGQWDPWALTALKVCLGQQAWKAPEALPVSTRRKLEEEVSPDHRVLLVHREFLGLEI